MIVLNTPVIYVVPKTAGDFMHQEKCALRSIPTPFAKRYTGAQKAWA